MEARQIDNKQAWVLTDDTGTTEVLVSYSTPVAAFIRGVGYVQTEVSYSKTTSAHIRTYCNLTRADTQRYVPQELLNNLFVPNEEAVQKLREYCAGRGQ